MTRLFIWNKNVNESECIPNTYPSLVIKFRIFRYGFLTFTRDPQPFQFIYVLVNARELRNLNQFVHFHSHFKLVSKRVIKVIEW